MFKAVFHAIKDTLLKGDLIADDKLGIKNENLQSTFETKGEEINFSNTLGTKSEKIKFNNTFGIQDKNLDKTIKLTDLNEELEKTVIANAKPVQKEGTLASLFHKLKKDTDQSEKEENIEDEEDLNQENLLAQIYANKFSENNEVNENIIPKNEVSENEVFENKFSENEENSGYELPIQGGVQEKVNNQEDTEIKNSFEKMYMDTFGGMPSEVRKREEEKKQKEEEYTVQQDEMKQVENVSIFLKEENQIPQYKFIGIAFSTYIILELNNELYILDQHAAHERILYEKVKKNYYSENEKDSQLMLLPDIINLSHKEMDIAKENMDMFRKAGFTLEEFGENTIKLSGVPNICLDLDTKELFLETLDEINTVARTAKQEKEEKFIATVACKAAVKANMALDAQEVDNLMKQLLVLPNPFTCPHGRPTAIRMTKNDIEKKFSRR